MIYSKNKLSKTEFDSIANHNWNPVILEEKNIPRAFEGMPDYKLYMCIGSGSYTEVNPEVDGNKTLTNQVGGIDVYRIAEEKDDAALNKDWYRIMLNPSDPNSFYLIKQANKRSTEHWLDDIPERLDKAITNS